MKCIHVLYAGALEMKCIHVLYAGVTYTVTQSVTSCTCDTLFLSQCRLCRLDVVQYLCADAGCDSMSEAKDGRTPLHFACR